MLDCLGLLPSCWHGLGANMISVLMLSDSGQCLIDKPQSGRWITADRDTHSRGDALKAGGLQAIRTLGCDLGHRSSG